MMMIWGTTMCSCMHRLQACPSLIAFMCAGPFGLPPEVLGDLILVASAGLWSLVMIRQSRHAPAFPAFELGTIKVL